MFLRVTIWDLTREEVPKHLFFSIGKIKIHPSWHHHLPINGLDCLLLYYRRTRLWNVLTALLFWLLRLVARREPLRNMLKTLMCGNTVNKHWNVADEIGCLFAHCSKVTISVNNRPVSAYNFVHILPKQHTNLLTEPWLSNSLRYSCAYVGYELFVQIFLFSQKLASAIFVQAPCFL